ncbi:MAG: GNAT family N-acetyltransferase [Sphaerochaeta sp.]
MAIIELISPPFRNETEALMSASFEKRYHSIFFLKEESTLIAREGNSVIGGINLDIIPTKAQKIGYIGWLYVDSNHRGRGLAQALVDEAVLFLTNNGCTTITACVEGDNYASAKQLTGFTIMGPLQQLIHFGTGIFKLNNVAARSFDMGYFLYTNTAKEAKTNLLALGGTIILNTLLLLPLYCKISILKPITYSKTIFLIPALTLIIRTAAMAIIAKKEGVYRGWDTAYLLGTILPFFFGVPFPVPGNVYLNGKPNPKTLKKMAIASTTALSLLIILLPSWPLRIYPIILLIFDTIFWWYPFGGFNAARLRKG